MDSVAELHAYFRDFDAQHSKCPVAQRQRELREEREAERERVRKGREAQRQRDEQLQSAEGWRAWAIAIADERIQAAMNLGGVICSAVGGALGSERKLVQGLRAEIAALREELKATTAKLHERTARLPVVKAWKSDTVHYVGDVVICNGATWQAKRDTGQKPGHADWILLAARGVDGIDGRTPRFRGAFLAHEKYQRFDVVIYDIGTFIAVRDNPEIIPTDGDGWQLLTLHGGRGAEGAVGPRGQKGERGARGEAAPTIINWTTDWKNYRAVPTLSNGTQGAVLDLRPLFEQFSVEFVLGAVDAAMQDAARTKLLSPLY